MDCCGQQHWQNNATGHWKHNNACAFGQQQLIHHQQHCANNASTSPSASFFRRRSPVRKRSKTAELEKETEDTGCQCDPGPTAQEVSTQVDPSQTRTKRYQIVMVRPTARVPPDCPICAGMAACTNNSAATSEDEEGLMYGQCINVKQTWCRSLSVLRHLIMFGPNFFFNIFLGFY